MVLVGGSRGLVGVDEHDPEQDGARRAPLNSVIAFPVEPVSGGAGGAYRSWAKPRPVAGPVSETVTLVIGSPVEVAANSIEPLGVVMDWATEPSGVAPSKKVAVIVEVTKTSDSASTPNVSAGVESVNVSVSAEALKATLGVLVSAFGGEFQLLQPPAGTVAVVNVGENETVSTASETELITVPSAGVIGIKVVAEVYAAVGWAIGLKAISVRSSRRSRRKPSKGRTKAIFRDRADDVLRGVLLNQFRLSARLIVAAPGWGRIIVGGNPGLESWDDRLSQP